MQCVTPFGGGDAGVKKVVSIFRFGPPKFFWCPKSYHFLSRYLKSFPSSRHYPLQKTAQGFCQNVIL